MKDLQTKHQGELEKLLHDKRERLRELRFAIMRGEVKNVKELSTQKKDIARILTLHKRQGTQSSKAAK